MFSHINSAVLHWCTHTLIVIFLLTLYKSFSSCMSHSFLCWFLTNMSASQIYWCETQFNLVTVVYRDGKIQIPFNCKAICLILRYSGLIYYIGQYFGIISMWLLCWWLEYSDHVYVSFNQLMALQVHTTDTSHYRVAISIVNLVVWVSAPISLVYIATRLAAMFS